MQNDNDCPSQIEIETMQLTQSFKDFENSLKRTTQNIKQQFEDLRKTLGQPSLHNEQTERELLRENEKLKRKIISLEASKLRNSPFGLDYFTQSSGNSTTCYFHKQFGNKARKCTPPCNFYE